MAQIETAYDIVLMERMKARLTGETRVSQDVRFADVPKTKPAPPVRLDRLFPREKRGAVPRPEPQQWRRVLGSRKGRGMALGRGWGGCCEKCVEKERKKRREAGSIDRCDTVGRRRGQKAWKRVAEKGII